MTTYSEKLKDPRWQRRRLEIFKKADFTCESCGATDKTLCVHHDLYLMGHEPWDYDDIILRCFCEECHEYTHNLKRLVTLMVKMGASHV